MVGSTYILRVDNSPPPPLGVRARPARTVFSVYSEVENVHTGSDFYCWRNVKTTAVPPSPKMDQNTAEGISNS